MNSLHIIMPMAGEGRRFSEKGYQQPKPLILKDGLPLYRRAIASISNFQVPKRFSFIIRAEHAKIYDLDKRIRQDFPAADIYQVERTTRGAVETCMFASSSLDDTDAVLILDCDLEFESKSLAKFIDMELSLPVNERRGGGLVSFISSDSRYSYAEVMGEDVFRTAEKKVISNHALAGAYYFSSALLFKQVAEELLTDYQLESSECYLSLLYNKVIAHGYHVSLFEMERYISNGTPEELELNGSIK